MSALPTPDNLTPEEQSRIRRAMQAVDAHKSKADYHLDIDQHARRLGPNAGELKAQLACDEVVRGYRAKYIRLDQHANAAKRRFVFAVNALTLIGTTSAMLAIFFSVVPPELPVSLRVVLSLVVGTLALVAVRFVLAALDVSIRDLPEFVRNVGRLLFVCGVSYLAYRYLILPEMLEQAHTWRMWSLGTLALTLVTADAVGGGGIGRLVAWLRSQSVRAGNVSKSLHQVWYEARGLAEACRRQYFMALLLDQRGSDGTTGALPPATPAASRSTLLSQQLEYFRRYQIEVQQNYYREKSDECRAAAERADWARGAALVAFVSMLAVFSISSFGGAAEQGQFTRTLPGASKLMIRMSQGGLDDISIVVALFALGIYAFLELQSRLFRERINTARFAKARGELELVTGRAEADLTADTPLNRARRAAVRGQSGEVATYFGAVNRVLGAEVGDWSDMTPYVITASGSPLRVRMLSSDVLKVQDFDNVVRYLLDYGIKARRARKHAVSARLATTVEPIRTYSDTGIESEGLAQPGDWIVTNMDRNGRILSVGEGRVDTYVIKPDRFRDLYYRGTGQTEHGEIYLSRAKQVEAVAFAGGLNIVAPWRNPDQELARQNIPNGYLVKNGNDIYGINIDAFRRTYDVLN